MTTKYILFVTMIITLLINCKQQKELKCDSIEIWEEKSQLVYMSFKNDSLAVFNIFKKILENECEVDGKYLKKGFEEITKFGEDAIDSFLVQLSKNEFQALKSISWEDSLLIKKINPIHKKISNNNLAKDLIIMYYNDQYVRGNILSNVIKKYNLKHDSILYNLNPIETDSVNYFKLRNILTESKLFPSINDVGEDGMYALFILIQHSKEISFQEFNLDKIRLACENGDLEYENYAYLFDRIKVRRGLKQRYGTQFSDIDLVNSNAILFPVEDSINVDVRRKKYNMVPLQMYKKIMIETIKD